MTGEGPWTFDRAREAERTASAAQAAVEELIKTAYHDYAVAEETYRKALAMEIVKCHNDGVAWSTAPDLARGDARVSELRRLRDIAEGVKEAVTQQSWRRAADRRAVDGFRTWSMRRELAEFHGRDPEEAIG